MTQPVEVKLVAKAQGVACVLTKEVLDVILKNINFTQQPQVKNTVNKIGKQQTQIIIDNQIHVQYPTQLSYNDKGWDNIYVLISLDQLIQKSLIKMPINYKPGTLYQLAFIVEVKYSFTNAQKKEQNQRQAISQKYQRDQTKLNQLMQMIDQTAWGIIKNGQFDAPLFAQGDKEYHTMINQLYTHIQNYIAGVFNPIQQSGAPQIQDFSQCAKEISIGQEQNKNTLYQYHLRATRVYPSSKEITPQEFIKSQQTLYLSTIGQGTYVLDLAFDTTGLTQTQLNEVSKFRQTLCDLQINPKWFDSKIEQQQPVYKVTQQTLIHLFKDKYPENVYKVFITPQIKIGYRKVAAQQPGMPPKFIFKFDIQSLLFAITKIGLGKQQTQQVQQQSLANIMCIFDDEENQWTENDILQNIEQEAGIPNNPVSGIIEQPNPQPQVPQQPIMQQPTVQQPINQQPNYFQKQPQGFNQFDEFDNQ